MEAGKSLDNERGRQRVREILERAKGEGPSDTDRVGERTAYRYLAAKSWLSLLQGQPPNYGGLNNRGSLNKAFMSPAGDGRLEDIGGETASFACRHGREVGESAHGRLEDFVDCPRLVAVNRTDEGQCLPWGEFASLGGFVESFEPGEEEVSVDRFGKDIVIDARDERKVLAPCA